MKVTCHGAAGGEVTGSAYHVQTGRANVLVDYGLFQGGRRADALNTHPADFRTNMLDAVLVTHAHLDHVGRLPLLVREGYARPIYATDATIDLARLILMDSAKIQLSDNAKTNRRRERAGLGPVDPLYSTEDVERLLSLFRPVAYDQPVAVAPGVRARYVEAGHMLGSTSICLECDTGGKTRKVVFSGDLGPHDVPILRDSVSCDSGDAVFLESTYGGREHRSLDETIAEFRKIIIDAVARKSTILIPTFAVGRAQLLIYLLAGMFNDNLVPPFPIYLDSPMAIEATRIYSKHPELFDQELQRIGGVSRVARDIPTLKYSTTADDSKAINFVQGPCLIMAGAGMATAGRILHHFRANLWKKNTTVLIVGYQAPGSLGRLLVDKVKRVRIFGETIANNASIHTLGGFSAHAGHTDLLNWVTPMAARHPQIFLTHGEDGPRTELAKAIHKKWGIAAKLPKIGEALEIA